VFVVLVESERDDGILRYCETARLRDCETARRRGIWRSNHPCGKVGWCETGFYIQIQVGRTCRSDLALDSGLEF